MGQQMRNIIALHQITVVDMFLLIMYTSHDIELNTSVAELCIIPIQLRVILNHQ